MLTQGDRMLALRQVPAFAGLDHTAMAGLLVCLRWRQFGDGEPLYRQGEAGDSLAIVVSGTLVVTVGLEKGGEYELARVMSGGIVGEMVCIDPAPRSATVTAVGPTLIAELKRDGLTALRSGAPRVYSAIMREVIRVVGLRLRELDHRIDVELGGKPGQMSKTKGLAAQASPALQATPSMRQGVGDLPKKRDGFMGLIDRLLGSS